MPLLPPTHAERLIEVKALKAEQTPTYLALVDRLMHAEEAMGNRPSRIVLNAERWRWLETEVLMATRSAARVGRQSIRLWMPWGSVDVVSEEEERLAIRLRALDGAGA